MPIEVFLLIQTTVTNQSAVILFSKPSLYFQIHNTEQLLRAGNFGAQQLSWDKEITLMLGGVDGVVDDDDDDFGGGGDGDD